MGLAIHLLGAPRAERDGQLVPAPRGQKVWALLAYLILHEGAASRTQLATLLFEEAEDPLAALRWNLSELRRLLGGAGLRGNLLQLSFDPTVYVDVDVLRRGTWIEALSVRGLGRELLEGMSFGSSPSFEVWLATERRRLQASAEAVLREATMVRLAAGAAPESIDLAGRLVRLNPLDENFQALLVRCLAAAGDGIGAARQAAACRELFMRELGVVPGLTLEAAMHTVTGAPAARPATGRAAVIAQLEAGEAAISAGALDAGQYCLRRAVVDADSTGDAFLRTRSRVALGAALVHAARGSDEEGATALHEALLIGETAAPPLAAAACRELGYVEFLRGGYERSLLWLQRAACLAAENAGERARIATIHGCVLSDTAHYEAATTMLREAEAHANSVGDTRQIAYTLSMLGRVSLLCGDLDAAAVALDRSMGLAQQVWTAILPWPQSLRAEVDLLQGNVEAASERLDYAFALACQLGDPCWEGIAGRGLGRVAIARGETQRAVEILVDTVSRCVRLPDAYLWGKGYALEVLCGLAVAHGMPHASAWIDELHNLAARSGMRELTARALLHRASLGDSASGIAAQMLACEIDNPALRAAVEPGRPSTQVVRRPQ